MGAVKSIKSIKSLKSIRMMVGNNDFFCNFVSSNIYKQNKLQAVTAV
jgi:hypothetical protein